LSVRFLLQAMTVDAIAIMASRALNAKTICAWNYFSALTHQSENATRNDSVLYTVLAIATSVAPQQLAVKPFEAAKREYQRLGSADARGSKEILQSHGIVRAADSAGNSIDARDAKNLSLQKRVAAKKDAQKQIDQFCDRGLNL